MLSRCFSSVNSARALALQVLFRSYILKHKYETSYGCLARRAAKTNNALNRFVRRGSVARRVCAYGEPNRTDRLEAGDMF